MGIKGYILTAANAALRVTNWFGSLISSTDTIDGIPLGTKDGTATGEVAVKVLSIGGTTSGVSVTPNFASLANSSQIIPIGAKGWTATILTGTGSIGGVTVPAGYSTGDNNTLLATVTITANAGSTAIVYWNT